MDTKAEMVSREKMLEYLHGMYTIRRFEERVQELKEDNEIAGSVHLGIGQEAIPVGACDALSPVDAVFATYRGHGWALACAAPPESVFAEILHRETGVNAGRGGSAHFSAPDWGFYGENSIVGAHAPIATGAALAAKFDGSARVSLCVFGEGAMNQGAVHEAMNFASALDLPVVFICENNLYSELTPIADMVRSDRMFERAGAYAMPGERVDGNDPVAIRESVGRAVGLAREGGGPSLIEAMTQRLVGHYNADVQQYRSKGELKEAKKAEPIVRLRKWLEDDGATADELDRAVEEIRSEVDAAADRALKAPLADVSRVREHLYGCETKTKYGTAARAETKSLNYVEAVNAALHRALEEIPETIIFGEDVAKPGGVFGATRGLRDGFGDRVFDTPISESAILGGAIGAAMMGRRPIAEIMWADFSLVALDQIVNQATNVRYVSNGRLKAPMTVRTQQGILSGSCAQHSQSMEAIFAQIPGLLVGIPATPQDAYDMLLSAIRTNDPAIVIEHRSLYFGPKQEVKLGGEIQPVGGARIVKEGTDATLVSWGRMLHTAIEAAEALEKEGVGVEVIDARWLAPFDAATVLNSVEKTHRAVIAHEANVSGGFGAEVAARIADEALFSLDAPIVRVGVPDCKIPAAPNLQAALVPDARSIAQAVRKVMHLEEVPQ